MVHGRYTDSQSDNLSGDTTCFGIVHQVHNWHLPDKDRSSLSANKTDHQTAHDNEIPQDKKCLPCIAVHIAGVHLEMSNKPGCCHNHSLSCKDDMPCLPTPQAQDDTPPIDKIHQDHTQTIACR
jgi:hypothetical protein